MFLQPTQSFTADFPEWSHYIEQSLTFSHVYLHVFEGDLVDVLDEFGVVCEAAKASIWNNKANGRRDFEYGFQECKVVCRTSVSLGFDRDGYDDWVPVDYPIAVFFGQIEEGGHLSCDPVLYDDA